MSYPDGAFEHFMKREKAAAKYERAVDECISEVKQAAIKGETLSFADGTIDRTYDALEWVSDEIDLNDLQLVIKLVMECKDATEELKRVVAKATESVATFLVDVRGCDD